MSDPVPVTSGVPQRTVLDPLMFLFYINDINQNINSKIRLFPDDCVLYRKINSKLDCSKLQQDLQKLVDWSYTWQMFFNINKCHTLHAHIKKQPIIHTYTIDNTSETPVTHHLYLGIELQSDLRWTTHIQNTTNKAQKTLNMPKINLKQASTTVKSQAYKKIVRPQLEYASAIWDPHTAKDTYNLNKIQNYAERWVHHDYTHYTSVSFLRKQLNWPPLSVRRLQSRLVLFYKICHRNIAIPIPPIYKYPSELHATPQT